MLLLVTGCSRDNSAKLQRFAILPGNILIADTSSEWMRSAVPLVLGQDLSASRKLVVIKAESESSVYQSGASETLRTTIEKSGSALTVASTLMDSTTQRVKRALNNRGENLIVELNAVAHAIDARAVSFSTQNENALRLFVNAAAATDLDTKVQGFRDAVTQDRAFGLAYIALTEVLANANNENGLKTILDSGQQNRASFSPADRARFDLLRARLLHAPVKDQTRTAESLVQLSPNEPDALAALASGLFLGGRAKDAEQLMHRALDINPRDAGLQQSLVNGLVSNRKFAEAEKVLTGMLPDQAVLPQIAFCALLEGDDKRADAVFQKFLSSVANPNGKSFLSASWLALNGHLDQAISSLRSAAFQDPRLTALSTSQVVLWQLMAKQYDAARNSASSGNAVAALLASGAPSADAWMNKVDIAGDERARTSLKGYGLYLFGYYSQAADVWREINNRAHGEDARARAMLAASLQKAGHTGEASKIQVQPFFPDFNDYYNALSFSALRSVLRQAG